MIIIGVNVGMSTNVSASTSSIGMSVCSSTGIMGIITTSTSSRSSSCSRSSARIR